MTKNTFEIKRQIRGVTITDEFVRELEEAGRTRILKFKDIRGKQYLAHFEVKDGKIVVVPEARQLKHRCPHCGGRILITSKGYFCEHSLGKQHSCKFHCNGILSHRFITPSELEAYLDGHPTIIDGCFNSQGKIFSAVLTENEGWGMSLTSVVGKCPDCGGDVLVSPVAFNCVGDNHLQGEPYHMSLWRHVKGHEVTLDELQELLTDGITSKEVILHDEKGSLSKAYLRLSEDKKRIVPEYSSDTTITNP